MWPITVLINLQVTVVDDSITTAQLLDRIGNLKPYAVYVVKCCACIQISDVLGVRVYAVACGLCKLIANLFITYSK